MKGSISLVTISFLVNFSQKFASCCCMMNFLYIEGVEKKATIRWIVMRLSFKATLELRGMSCVRGFYKTAGATSGGFDKLVPIPLSNVMDDPFPDPRTHYRGERVVVSAVTFHPDYQNCGTCFGRLGPGVEFITVFNTLADGSTDAANFVATLPVTG